jgi:hypothetical protein
VAFFRWTDFTKLKWNADYEEMTYRALHCKRAPEMITDLENFVNVVFMHKKIAN